MSRWADSTDDDDDYLNEGDHEDYIGHAVSADDVSILFVTAAEIPCVNGYTCENCCVQSIHSLI